jgi:hypothetical protein
MLAQRYPLEKLRAMLIPHESWHPFPTAAERGAWESLPPSIRQAHLARGEAALGFAWPALPATLFLECARTGNRANYQNVRNVRRDTLRDLIIAECMEGRGRFVDDIVNGIWTTLEESYWGVPAHLHMQKAGRGLPDTAEPTVDLFAAETASLLAWAVYLIGPQLDEVSPLIRPRIHRELDYRILTPCLERDDFGWMGFGPLARRVNNWNPWINSNWLTTALLMEEDAERRLATVAKILRSLDNFIDPYPKDGGCDEGPSYWNRAGGSLFDCLELLHSSTAGQIDVYDEPLIQEIGRFIYRVQIADIYFINFADAPAVVTPPAALIFRYGQRIGDPEMMALGAWAAHHQGLLNQGLSDSIGRQLRTLFPLSELVAAEARQPLPRDVWLEEIEVMVARDRAGSAEGLFVAAKGGHNQESHNHNDIGNAIVYLDGRPLLVDAGVETYTLKTFSPQRYEIWTMQSAYHTLPTIDGVMQAPGPEFAAREVVYRADDASAQLTLDIAAAYPPQANLNSWLRTVTLKRGQAVQIVDRYDLSQPAQELTLSLLTPCEVDLGQPGYIALRATPLPDGRRSAAGQITYEANKLTPSTEVVPIEDERLRPIWGDHLKRIILRAENPPRQDTWQLQISP